MKRLISCTSSDFASMTAQDVKASIQASEGRVILAQSLLMMQGLAIGITNPELEAAFGADLLLLNGYSVNPAASIPGLVKSPFSDSSERFTLAELKALVRRPVGVYLECVDPERAVDDRHDRSGRLATPEIAAKAIEGGADFLILGGNPSSGVLLDRVISSTRQIREALGDDPFLMAGKWEDGSVEPVLGDPASPRPATSIIEELIDAGADVITLPAPGSRTGISVDMIRECVEFTHFHRPGTLALAFLDGSVEGTDVDTIRQIGLLMKETGADIHAIGDGGLAGCALPENVFQLSLTIKGRGHTYHRMAANAR